MTVGEKPELRVTWIGVARFAMIAGVVTWLSRGGTIAIGAPLLLSLPLTAIVGRPEGARRWSALVDAYAFAIFMTTFFAGERLGLVSCKARMILCSLAVAALSSGGAAGVPRWIGRAHRGRRAMPGRR